MTIAVAIPCIEARYITAETRETAKALEKLGFDIHARERCSDLPRARSTLTFELLEKYDAVLWLDSDVTVEKPEALVSVCNKWQHSRVVMVGAYPQKGGQLGLAVFPQPKALPAESFRVESAGAGCMLIPRIVAQEVGSKLPELREKSGRKYRPIFHKLLAPPVELGEDISFCLRCRQLDIPIVAEPSVNLGHVRSDLKTIDWTESYL